MAVSLFEQSLATWLLDEGDQVHQKPMSETPAQAHITHEDTTTATPGDYQSVEDLDPEIENMPLPPERTFATLEEARRFANEWSRKCGYDFSVGGNSTATNKRASCSRGGKARTIEKVADVSRQRPSRSVKCGCPVYIRFKQDEPTGAWRIVHPQREQARVHNHERLPPGVVSANQRRAERTPEMNREIEILHSIGVTVGQITAFIKAKYPETSQTRRDIQNVVNVIENQKKAADG